jgi:redox-sensing transcriptional repressor
MANNREIPDATVGRLPVYLRVLQEGLDRNQSTVSSQRLAELTGVNAAKVRKDLSYLGTYGIRGVGYDVRLLVYRIQRELGLTQDWPVAIVGFGNLGRALANYKGFAEKGFRIAAIFDSDDSKVGERIGEISVKHTDDLKEVCRDEEIAIAIVATPAASAQEVARQLSDAGVKAILNFAPVVISVPDATIRKVDLSMELQILTFYQQRNRQLPESLEDL